MLIVLAFLFPIVAGIVCATRKLSDEGKRKETYIGTLVITDVLGILALFFGSPVTLARFSDKLSISFALDATGRCALFAVLALYTAVTFYAFDYMKMEEEDPRPFFGFFFVSMGALVAVCGASNLVTVYLAFELATLSSMPLVLFEGTREAIVAAQKYLYYSIAGALMGLLGVFFAYYYSTGEPTFVLGSSLDTVALSGHEGLFLIAIFAAILGFGTKAGMYPMHGWLPTAHPIAPAPASALLSGIIAKAGILAVIRLVYYTVGCDFLLGTWVQKAWQILAMLTVFMGSMMAFREKVVKKRLAYSTVSQISYIMIALSTLSLDGLKGGMLHMMQHAASKGCLFLVAGVFIYRLGKRRVDELKGIGFSMPVTMWCFLIASLSLIGIPPLGGFLSKWYIASAVIGHGSGAWGIVPVVILLISALLTAGYLLPVVVDAFFPGKDFEGEGAKNCEPGPNMIIPMICLCCVTLFVGLFGGRVVEVLF